MPYTISHDFNGYHGHRLKDVLGAHTLGHLFDLKYVHTPFPYLDFFGVGYNTPVQSKWTRRLKYSSVLKIDGPFWNGFDNYDEMVNHFSHRLKSVDDNTLVVFAKACRVFPHQTIPWYTEGRIDKDIFSLISSDVTHSFELLHGLKQEDDTENDNLHVAIHINRGTDYDRIKYPDHFESPSAVRYIFPLDYFENIMEQIKSAHSEKKVTFTIYTESLHSEEIVDRFQNRENTTVQVGTNRRKKDNSLIHSIFIDFVTADILVSCNSSFSAMCAYFRRGKKTIYHPHLHLSHLPEPDYIKTDSEGNLDKYLLKR